MAAPTRKGSAKAKSEKFSQNITKRGLVRQGKDKSSQFSVGPVVLAFFLFVVVGSAILQIIRTAQTGQPDI